MLIQVERSRGEPTQKGDHPCEPPTLKMLGLARTLALPRTGRRINAPGPLTARRNRPPPENRLSFQRRRRDGC